MSDRTRPGFDTRVALCILASVLAACSWQTPHSQTSRSNAADLLHALQNALGGAKQIAAVRDLEETIRAEAWDSTGASLGTVRKRTRWIRTPSVVRLDQKGPRGTYVLYFDGRSDSGWEILPDLRSLDPFKTTGTVIPLAGGELQFARGYLSGFELNLWLADQMPGYRAASPAPGILRIEHGTTATDFTLDPITSLPVKSSGVSLADPDHPVPSEMRYEGWREIAGVRFPTHRVNYMSGVKRGEVTTSDIHVNVGLVPQDLAATPDAFAPDIPGT